MVAWAELRFLFICTCKRGWRSNSTKQAKPRRQQCPQPALSLAEAANQPSVPALWTPHDTASIHST